MSPNLFNILIFLAMVAFVLSAMPRAAAKFPTVNFDGAGKALLVGALLLRGLG
jgi:hypothetical protein